MARDLQNPLHMIWRNGTRGFCNNNNGNVTSSSTISDILGRSRLAKTTKCLAPASYWLGIQKYRGTAASFAPSHDHPQSGWAALFPSLHDHPQSGWPQSIRSPYDYPQSGWPASFQSPYDHPQSFWPASFQSPYDHPQSFRPVSYSNRESDYSADGKYVHGVYRNMRRPPLFKAETFEAFLAASKVSSIVASLYIIRDNQEVNQGTGTIIDPNGSILTCAHILGSQKSAEALKEMKVHVTLDPSQKYSGLNFMGTVLYADFYHDIAIIKITPFAPLQAAKLGSSQELCSRDVLFSAGRLRNSHFDWHPQFIANEGRYISGHGGLFGELLPVKMISSVDMGSDGGPLFNCNGEVVGVMKGGKSANSYAISIDVVSKVLEHFKKHGRVIQSQLGVTIGAIQETDETRSDVSQCVRVVKVTPESPADRGGLLPDDVITEFDGKSVGSFREFMNIMWDNVGKPLKMVVKRAMNKSVTLTVVPDEASLDTHDWQHNGSSA